MFLISDKNTNNEFQESSTFSQRYTNISEVNLEQSKSQSLITASEQLKQHLSSNYGFSNLDEYNSHILPPRKSSEINKPNIISPGGDFSFL